MRVPRGIAIFLCACATFAHMGAASAASTQTILVVNDPSTPSGFAFSPNPAEVLQGNDVQWDNQTIQEHTATSDQGFFRQDLQFVPSGLVSMAWSGKYRYHCEFHASMHGTIDNGLLIDAPSATKGSTLQIIWASQSIPAEQDMDVQVKRPGDTRFRAFKMNQTASQVSAPFVANKRGTYKFRVRRQFTGTKNASAYEIGQIHIT